MLDNYEVEGLLFKYKHFWGDYTHYQDSHCWYRKEIRIIRNDPEIHSWESAQSFRRIPGFDKINYRQQEGTFKLKVAEVDAYIYHYGWVRPPAIMSSKIRAFRINHHGKERVGEQDKKKLYDNLYDYGNLSVLPEFTGSHPSVMKEWIAKYNWKEQLRFNGPAGTLNPLRNKHDRLKYRIISWIEKKLLFNTRLGEFKNYKIIKV